MPQPAVFLDRDGTLVHDVGYLSRLDQVTLYPFTIEALRLLAREGFKLVIVTNQAGVARGYFDEAFVQDTHRYLSERFAAAGVRVDGFYYCPHVPDATVEAYRRDCACRKPKPGLVRQAARDLDLALDRSFAVGDKWADVEMAGAVGARGVLVRTGYGATEEARPRAGVRAAAIADNLMDATAWIIREHRR
jgi:D-glycero-D-manno-heptose 1,7-bisphosphate phosphatase